VPSVTIHLSYDAVSRYAELLCVLSFTIKLIMLFVVMLSVIIMSVMVLPGRACSV
jgi:hypothetical protein